MQLLQGKPRYILVAKHWGIFRPTTRAWEHKREMGIECMMELDDRWLSVSEIAKYLGVSGDTIYRWIDKQAMPAHRVGRAWKFKKDEVDAWVRSGGASDGNSSNA